MIFHSLPLSIVSTAVFQKSSGGVLGVKIYIFFAQADFNETLQVESF